MGSASRTIAQDEKIWRNVFPNGKEHEGRPVLFESTTGVIEGGVGGALNGKNIKNVSKGSRAKERQARRAAKKASRQALSIDLTNPEKLDAKAVLQNRNRSTQASVGQMRAIARDPDYARLGVTNDFGSGAPVVAYGSIPEKQRGRITEAVMPDGQRYTVQYAVVEADKVLTSNDIAGGTNPDYFSDDATKTRAIAGNGRLTGLAAAYASGKADEYFDALADDPLHGIKSSVIDNMDKPVLVRIMQPKDVTADIGDRSNRQTGLTLSAVETANNDANRIDFDKIKTYEDGTLTRETVKAFVAQMPANEQGSLIDIDGEPTAQAAARANAAVFAKAYRNDALTRLKTQALEPEARTIINGLAQAAPAVAKLEGLGDGYDIRDILAHAAVRSVQAIRKGQPLDAEAKQYEMGVTDDDHEASSAIVEMFAKNRRSAKAIGQKLIALATKLYDEASFQADPSAALFGELDKIPRNDIIRGALGKDQALSKMSPEAVKLWNKHVVELLAWMLDGGERPKVLLEREPKRRLEPSSRERSLAALLLILVGLASSPRSKK